MSKPFKHSMIDAKKFGGNWEDYVHIHDFLDSTKAIFPSHAHRFGTHHAWGCFLAEKVFGHTLTNSVGKLVSTREIAESHNLCDFGGFIPTVSDWLDNLTNDRFEYTSFDYNQLNLIAYEYRVEHKHIYDIHKELISPINQFPAQPNVFLLTHNSWFVGINGPIERIYGKGNLYLLAIDIAQELVRQAVGSVPSFQDVCLLIREADWMANGRGKRPTSCSGEKTIRKVSSNILIKD